MFARILKSGCVILVCATLSALRAEEQTVIYRVVGLCSPDRQDDLREAFKEVPNVQIASIDYDNAECTLRFDLAKLGFDPKKPPDDDKVLTQLANRLHGVTHGLFTLKARCALPKDKLQHLDIKIGILDCKGCRLGTYYSIARMDGVEQANLIAKPSEISAWIDPAKVKREALIDALKKARVDLPAE
jgi:hypothetical protein